MLKHFACSVLLLMAGHGKPKRAAWIMIIFPFHLFALYNSAIKNHVGLH